MVKRNSEKKFSWKTLLFVLLIVALGISIALYATDVVRYSPEYLDVDYASDTGSGSANDDACKAAEDVDEDGFCNVPFGETPADCNDEEALINPDAIEMCQDGIDNNCNQLVDCADSDCQGYIVTKEGSSIPGSEFTPPRREVAMCCSGKQVNFTSDNNNCGFCGNVCSPGTTCTVFPPSPPGCAKDNCAAPPSKCYINDDDAQNNGKSIMEDFLRICVTNDIRMKIDSVPLYDPKGVYTGKSWYCVSFEISFR